MDAFADYTTAFNQDAVGRFAAPVNTCTARFGLRLDEKGNFVRSDEKCELSETLKGDLEPLSLQAKSCCTRYQECEELLKELQDIIKKKKDEINTLNTALDQIEKNNNLLRGLLYNNISKEKQDAYSKASGEYFKILFEIMGAEVKCHTDTINASNETIDRIRANQSELRKAIALAIQEVFPENPLAVNPTDCGICKVNSCTHVFVPCGHTGCEDCTTRLANGQSCYYCRAPVERSIKLYLG